MAITHYIRQLNSAQTIRWLDRLGLDYNPGAHLSILKSLLFANKDQIEAAVKAGDATFGPVEALYFIPPIPEEDENAVTLEDLQNPPDNLQNPRDELDELLDRIYDRVVNRTVIPETPATVNDFNAQRMRPQEPQASSSTASQRNAPVPAPTVPASTRTASSGAEQIPATIDRTFASLNAQLASNQAFQASRNAIRRRPPPSTPIFPVRDLARSRPRSLNLDSIRVRDNSPITSTRIGNSRTPFPFSTETFVCELASQPARPLTPPLPTGLGDYVGVDYSVSATSTPNTTSRRPTSDQPPTNVCPASIARLEDTMAAMQQTIQDIRDRFDQDLWTMQATISSLVPRPTAPELPPNTAPLTAPLSAPETAPEVHPPPNTEPEQDVNVPPSSNNAAAPDVDPPLIDIIDPPPQTSGPNRSVRFAPSNLEQNSDLSQSTPADAWFQLLAESNVMTQRAITSLLDTRSRTSDRPPAVSASSTASNSSSNLSDSKGGEKFFKFLKVCKENKIGYNTEDSNVNRFIVDLTKVANDFNMSDHDKVNAVPHLLFDKAKAIYEAKVTEGAAWPTVCQILRDTFFSADKERALKKTIHDRRQAPGELFNTYLAWLHEQNNFLKKPYTPEELADIIRANALPLFIRTLATYDALTLAEVEKICRKIEVGSAYIDANKQDPARTASAPVSSGSRQNSGWNRRRNNFRNQQNGSRNPGLNALTQQPSTATQTSTNQTTDNLPNASQGRPNSSSRNWDNRDRNGSNQNSFRQNFRPNSNNFRSYNSGSANSGSNDANRRPSYRDLEAEVQRLSGLLQTGTASATPNNPPTASMQNNNSRLQRNGNQGRQNSGPAGNNNSGN